MQLGSTNRHYRKSFAIFTATKLTLNPIRVKINHDGRNRPNRRVLIADVKTDLENTIILLNVLNPKQQVR